MANNYNSDQNTEPDNESLELVLAVGKSFQSWDKALNFFTEYCHQKGFSYLKRRMKLLKLLQV